MSEFLDADYDGRAIETIRLYIDLEPDARANLEVVARASLEFAASIRELAFVLDPSLVFRIELISGTENSLSLNSFLRAAGLPTRRGRWTLRAIAIAMAMYFGPKTVDWTYEKLLDTLFTKEEQAQIPAAVIEQIAGRTAEILESRVASSQVQRVYRELQTDPAISGVTVTRSLEGRPVTIVPRAEFDDRAGLVRQEVEGATRRIRDEIVTLRLISPVLEDSRRQWRFRGASGDFSAAMKDARFLDDLLQGRSAVPMVSNIQMDVELRTIEERRNGIWYIRERSILNVRQVRPPAAQSSLDLPRPPR